MVKKDEEKNDLRNYTTVSIPVALIKKVDAVIESGAHGYRNRADFVLDAIRKRLRELDFLV